ncbi:MAG: CRTAC1 family protein, partial [Dyadobacter sp.]
MLEKLIYGVLLLFLCTCKGKKVETLFTLVDPSDSGISFSNQVKEDPQFNVLEYQYLYNGGGVAIGDVNGDGLPDIYFSGNQVPNRLYLNKGGLKFEDVTDKSGVTGRSKWKTGISMADVNGDGLLDIYVCYSGPGTDADRRNELYINKGVKEGVPIFEERAADFGLDAGGTFTTQVTFFDMDHDNDLDLFMVNHGDMFYNAFYNTAKLRNTRHPKFGNRLYRNDQGHFSDISEQAGIDGSGLNFGLSASVGDVNGDGWPDIYTTNDYNEQDFLYINLKNGTFHESLQKSMGHISKFSMGSAITDLNNDLLADIVTLDMLPGDSRRQKLLKGSDEYDNYQQLVNNGFHHQNMRNMLQLNQGNSPEGTPLFSEIGQLAGISNTDWSWSALAADFDNDGSKDLYITNGYLRDFTNMDFLKFTYQQEADAAVASGRKLDSWKILQHMPSTKTSNYCFANRRGGMADFKDVTLDWGLFKPSISTGAAYADLDNDGDLDIIVNNSNETAMLYENRAQGKEQNHYLNIRLRGKSGNLNAIGAKVTVKTSKGLQMQELYPGSSFQSSNEALVHFGLGNHSKAEFVKILWPDGTQSEQFDISADTTLTYSENSTQTKALITSTNPAAPWFSDNTRSSGLFYSHQESNYVDFKHQSLLPYQLSKQGPYLSKGDVNAD